VLGFEWYSSGYIEYISSFFIAGGEIRFLGYICMGK